MNAKATFAALALLVGSVFTSAAFAQSGTITFTGSIVAPACTGSSHTGNPAQVSLDTCAASEAQVVRTSVANAADSNASSVQTVNANSAVVTVSYE